MEWKSISKEQRLLYSTRITDLESVGYTYVSWMRVACVRKRSQGFRLMQLRGQVGAEAIFSDMLPLLRCGKCGQKAAVNALSPSTQRQG